MESGISLLPGQDHYHQLVGQDAHDTIGELPESHQPEELDHAAWKEQPPDVPPQDDTIEATVFELDILGELLHKGILHGQYPLWVIGFGEPTL